MLKNQRSVDNSNNSLKGVKTNNPFSKKLNPF
jgi:hypothetical protein